jgi:uncharacterized protein
VRDGQAKGCVLVVAKSPVPGEAKTRLARHVGFAAAADLAAAALLDTLEAAAAAFPVGQRVLAVTGDLDRAARADELRAAIRSWVVVPQRGRTFAERLTDAHEQAHRSCSGPAVQIGMDTPHADAALLRSLADVAHRHGRPVLGPALDGGWWVLVTTRAHQAAVLAGVPMSRPDTGRLTAAALASAGHPPLDAPALRDVDVVVDAVEVARAAPRTRFARAWVALAERDDLPAGEPSRTAR